MSELFRGMDSLEQDQPVSAPATPERHLRIDEIRRLNETLMDDIIIAQSFNGAVSSGSMTTTTRLPVETELIPHDPNTWVVMELSKMRKGKVPKTLRYVSVLREYTGDKTTGGLPTGNSVSLKFRQQDQPLNARGFSRKKGKSSERNWQLDRSEELSLYLTLQQALNSCETQLPLAS